MREQSVEAFFGMCVVSGLAVILTGIASLVGRMIRRHGYTPGWDDNTGTAS